MSETAKHSRRVPVTLQTARVKRRSGRRRLTAMVCAILGGLVLLAGGPVASQEPDLSEMSLEELMNIEVTSVSKKAEKRTEAAAAIFVLTNEDIRRSGATSIPDALRLVPGLSVARIDANKWSVTARGFGGRFANRLLVLIDGRSVYTPQFSGVYWEVQDVMLEDVDRIEVIRGPGGALWGANAVNGVINIVRKRAEDTQGGLLTVGAGTEERGFGAIRYGGKLKDKGYFRVYGKYFDRDEAEFADGSDANDDVQMGQIGFRVDLTLQNEDQITIQGDFFDNEASQTIDLPFLTAPFSRRTDESSPFVGGNLLTRWERKISDTSDMQLQFYYDYYRLDAVNLEETRHTFDVEFQYHQMSGDKHDILWGLGIRHTQDEQDVTEFVRFTPKRRRDDTFSAFVQDQIALTDTLRLTLGSKVEHNDFTGFEIQPSARLAWTPNEKHTLWGSVSRAVRTPSRAEADVQLLSETSAGPLALVLEGTRDFDSEDLLAVELGYRVAPTERVAIDIATFYNTYDDYRTIEAGTPFLQTIPAPDHTVIPFFARNNGEAETWGFEAVLDWKPKSFWKVRASYSYLEVKFDLSPDSLDLITPTLEGDTPEQQFFVQNSFDLPHNVEIDAIVRYVDRLKTLPVKDYLTMDLRVGWQPKENLDISIMGQNLFDDAHFEFDPTLVSFVPTKVQRGVYGKVTWRF